MFKGLRKKIHSYLMMIGIAVIIAGFVASGVINGFNEKAIETASSIVEINEEEKDLMGSAVYVQYNVNGTSYTEELGYYEEDMIEGQTIMIKYDPEEPTNIRPVDGPDTVKNIYILGGCIFAAGALLRIMMNVRERKAADRRAEKRYERKNGK